MLYDFHFECILSLLQHFCSHRFQPGEKINILSILVLFVEFLFQSFEKSNTLTFSYRREILYPLLSQDIYKPIHNFPRVKEVESSTRKAG